MTSERELSVREWIAARPKLYDSARWGMRPRTYRLGLRVPAIPAVYFLLDDALAVLYVGMSTNVAERLLAHWRQDRVPFTKVVYRQTPERALVALEAYLIGLGMPPYNRKFCNDMETEAAAVAEAIRTGVLGGSFP